jgi:kynureninase
MDARGFFTKGEVQKYLQATAESLGVKLDSDAFAIELDRRDPLARLRSNFNIPIAGQLLAEGERSADVDPSSECVYLCGNSLGLQPKTTRAVVAEALDSWAERGVRGHFMGPNAWMPIEDSVIPGLAKLVGAKATEVTAMNSLTVNLHLGLVPFYKPTPDRYKILMEENPFPSDLYAVQSQVRWHGYEPDSSIVFAKAEKPGGIWRDEDVVNLIDEVGDSVALVLLSGVHFSTGHFFDIMSITEAGHRKGCCVGWDLAHAVGNVELALHDWGVDFACWCTYKYLNSGPGSVAGFFVHENHARKPQLSRLIGWWAHDRDTRLKMDNVLELQAGAKGFQLSNPPVLECCCLQASLAVFEQTSLKQLVQKARLLTGYLELLLEESLSSKKGETISSKMCMKSAT